MHSRSSKGPSMRVLWDSLRGPGMRSCSRSFTTPCVNILWRSWWNTFRGLCMILCRSLWEALEEVLLAPSRCICVVWWGSLWGDLVQILLKSSSRGPCIKIFKVLCIGACLKLLLGCSYEVLVWRSCQLPYKIVYVAGPPVAVAVMPHLTWYCSIATVACIWCIGFLPPHTVWGLLPVHFFSANHVWRSKDIQFLSIESCLFIVPLFRVVVGAELSETFRPGINSWVAKRPSSLRSIWANHLQQRWTRTWPIWAQGPWKQRVRLLVGVRYLVSYLTM